MKECTVCGRCHEDSFALCLEDGGGLALTYPGPAVLDGKYRLVKRLGQGGMGTVYRALHLGLERPVAVKLLRTDRGGEETTRRESFLDEARALARLDHPNIVAVTDFGVDAATGIPYLVLELLEGTTLSERLRRGSLPLAEAMPILSQVAAALDEVHGRGILHQDLKAGNVWLTKEEPPRAKLLDFGLASRSRETTETAIDAAPAGERKEPPAAARGELRGTPQSLAPELWRGEPPSTASDVWAFGVLAYTLVVGRPPFAGVDPAVLRVQIEQGAPRPSVLRPDLDARWDEPLLAPLRPDPAGRPAQAGEVARALAGVAERLAARHWRRREAPRRVAAAAVLGLLAGWGGLRLEPALEGVENRLVDLRFAASSPRSPGKEILLVRLDDETLAAWNGSLVEMGEPLGLALERAFEAGAAGVAIDLLLYREWAEAPAFSLLVAKRARRMVLGATSTPRGEVAGTEALDPAVVAVLGREKSAELFGFVEVESDGDGVVRHAPLAVRDTERKLQPPWASRAAGLLSRAPALTERRIWIDTRVDASDFASISAHELAEADPARLHGRLLLVGEDLEAGGDRHRVRQPGGIRLIPGVELQALIVETLLRGEPVRSAPQAWVAALAGVAAGLAAAAALFGRRRVALLTAAGLVAAWIAASWGLFLGGGWMVPIAAPLCALGLAVLISLALRRWGSA